MRLDSITFTIKEAAKNIRNRLVLYGSLAIIFSRVLMCSGVIVIEPPPQTPPPPSSPLLSIAKMPDGTLDVSFPDNGTYYDNTSFSLEFTLVSYQIVEGNAQVISTATTRIPVRKNGRIHFYPTFSFPANDAVKLFRVIITLQAPALP